MSKRLHRRVASWIAGLASPFAFGLVLTIGNGASIARGPHTLVGPSAAPVTRSQIASAGAPHAAGPAGGDIELGGTNEPTIAVNPTNPLNVAYASLFELRISNDAGATYGPPVVAALPFTHFLCGDSSLAFDSQGRLFWSYLGCPAGGIDVFVAQVDPTTGAILPGYPVNVTDSPEVNLPGSEGFGHDKEWLAADAFAGSPFADSLYLVWTEFGLAGGTRVLTTFSRDQGVTWSAAVQLSGLGEGFEWPAHNTVAPNGDVYVAYHSDAGGQVFVVRSTDGGASYAQKTLAYHPGQADMTWNVQSAFAPIAGTQFWLQGSAQPWILADPQIGRLYVIANDDPDDDFTSGDPADVFIVVSEDDGLTWSSPRRVDSGPAGTFQVMPTAAIDRDSGCISVHYYDNRNGALNGDDHFLLDVFATTSVDGGLTFAPDFQINDVPFDPDPGASIRFSGPPPTTRIGEYNGVAVGGGLAHAVWCGNVRDGQGEPVAQQSITDGFVCLECEPATCDDGNPCNGTEACDDDSGLCLRTVTDCNGNGNDDLCDISGCAGDPACSDCNANGIPDYCDLFAFFEESSSQLSPIGAGFAQNYTLAFPPEAAGEVTFSFSSSADLEDAFQWIDVTINGEPLARLFDSDGHLCPLLPDSAQVTMAADAFNAHRIFGNVSIAMIPSSTVNADLCSPAPYIEVTVAYLTMVGTDCNGNGTPDVCEPDCQPNGVADECDISTGASDDVNGNGVPDECEACENNAACDNGDVCAFSRCMGNTCSVVPAAYGDVAGQEGTCGPDGMVNIFDIFAVLDGFQDVFATGCEPVNIDVAGAEGSCTPNGQIDIFDIFAVLDAFQSIDPCCGGTAERGGRARDEPGRAGAAPAVPVIRRTAPGTVSAGGQQRSIGRPHGDR